MIEINPILPQKKKRWLLFFATEHFRRYLLGNKSPLVTDHSALRWLHSDEPKGRQARWVMDLQEYSFAIKHRPGSANGNADVLSRLPSSEAPEQVPTCSTSFSSGYDFQQKQMILTYARLLSLSSKTCQNPLSLFGLTLLPYELYGMAGLIFTLLMAY